MAAGLEVLNANGILQVTSDYKNLQFIGKGTVSVTSFLDASLIGDAGEVIAFRVNEADKWGLTPPRIYTGQSTTKFAVKYGTSATITYYRFKYTGIAAGNYFEVYNAAGERCFSDSAPFMRVIGFNSGPDCSNAVTVSHATSITAAVVACKLSSRYNPLGGSAILAAQMFNFASGVVTAENHVESGLPGLPYYGYKNYAFLTLDVTGL